MHRDKTPPPVGSFEWLRTGHRRFFLTKRDRFLLIAHRTPFKTTAHYIAEAEAAEARADAS